MGTSWSSRLTGDATRVSCVGHTSVPTPTAMARSHATTARRRVRSPSQAMGRISASPATAATRPQAYRRIDSTTPILISSQTSQIDPIDLSYYTLPMAMGKRQCDRQPRMWVATTDFPTAASHPFYTRLNRLLREHGFDGFAEAQCATFYAETMG